MVSLALRNTSDEHKLTQLFLLSRWLLEDISLRPCQRVESFTVGAMAKMDSSAMVT